MKRTIYQCMECNKIFGTTFISDGINCPYCGGLIGPIGDVIDRTEYKELESKKKLNKIRLLKSEVIKVEDVLKGAIATWGPELQQIVAIEECSEVIKEICKYERGQYSKLHMAEEIADLQIVLGQLVIMYGKTNILSSFTSNSTKELIVDISYMQMLISDSLRGDKVSADGIEAQIENVYVRINWFKKYLDIEKLVDVYVSRKVDRLRKRIIIANKS